MKPTVLSLVNSQTKRGVSYLVDMKLGVCSCIAGQDGSVCSHQAAIVKLFQIPSVNCIPSLSPTTRKILAEIAMGPKAIHDPKFYSSLHEKRYNDAMQDSSLAVQGSEEPDISDFSGTAWNLVRAGAMDSDSNSETDIKARASENTVVAQGMKTFLRRYKNLTCGTFQNARLSSALHRFGWVFGGNIKRSQGGSMRRGRRIPVNAQSAGRRRKCISRGKAKLPPGRPKGMKVAVYPPSRFQLPCRRQPPGKRQHSLKAGILAGTQNAGKW